jgi:hypothetical protein
MRSPTCSGASRRCRACLSRWSRRQHSTRRPQAAVVDLTENPERVSVRARDLQALLQQDVVPRSTFAQMVERYSRAVDRFKTARDKYDGTLRRRWSADVLPRWGELRDHLWNIHLVFFRLNGDSARRIVQTDALSRRRAGADGADRAGVGLLEAGMARFADDLGRKGVDDATREDASPVR